MCGVSAAACARGVCEDHHSPRHGGRYTLRDQSVVPLAVSLARLSQHGEQFRRHALGDGFPEETRRLAGDDGRRGLVSGAERRLEGGVRSGGEGGRGVLCCVSQRCASWQVPVFCGGGVECAGGQYHAEGYSRVGVLGGCELVFLCAIVGLA